MMWRNPIGWLLAIICLVLLLAFWSIASKFSGERGRNIAPQNNTATGPTKLPSQLAVFAADPVRGSRGADVTIIEFGDFECVYCGQAARVLEKVISENPGKIKLVWKDFPLPGHPQSFNAAEAAQCAGKQGKFWEYHDALFETETGFGPNTYLRLAGEIGLDVTAFNKCLQNNDVLPLIQFNVKEGTAIGVDGTPFFVINGQVVNGLITEEQLLSFLK